MTFYAITPAPAPRQTKQDKWNPSPSVQRYRLFSNLCIIHRVTVPEIPAFRFHIEMPASWSQKKRDRMKGTPHLQKPDVDNLFKAVLDSVYRNKKGVNDSHVWCAYKEKIWSEKSGFEIINLSKNVHDLIQKEFA